MGRAKQRMKTNGLFRPEITTVAATKLESASQRVAMSNNTPALTYNAHNYTKLKRMLCDVL